MHTTNKDENLSTQTTQSSELGKNNSISELFWNHGRKLNIQRDFFSPQPTTHDAIIEVFAQAIGNPIGISLEGTIEIVASPLLALDSTITLINENGSMKNTEFTKSASCLINGIITLATMPFATLLNTSVSVSNAIATISGVEPDEESDDDYYVDISSNYS